MRRVALVTAGKALALDEDMPPLVSAFGSLGWTVETPCWDDPSVDWACYDVAVLRSTWDYMDRLGAFLAWTEDCATHTLLMNPPGLVRWNTDKHYLLDVARTGVPVVPTRFAEPGEPAADALAAFLSGGPDALSAGTAPAGFAEFVVKPAIGVGSRDAARYPRTAVAPATAHVDRLLRAGRSVLLQPYLSRVDEHGETAMVYLAGRFSHAAGKAALLKPGAGFVAGLFAPEEITPRAAAADELTVGAAACAVVAKWQPLYARVDLVRDAAGSPVVLELELAEPSLFFPYAPGSAGRFAEAVLHRVAEVSGGDVREAP